MNNHDDDDDNENDDNDTNFAVMPLLAWNDQASGSTSWAKLRQSNFWQNPGNTRTGLLRQNPGRQGVPWTVKARFCRLLGLIGLQTANVREKKRAKVKWQNSGMILAKLTE